MDYLVKIRSVQTPLNGQFSIGANSPVVLPDEKWEVYERGLSFSCTQQSGLGERSP